MKRIEFERLLDECLARLEAGESLEAILQDSGRAAEKLEPLLKAAQLTLALPDPGHEQSLREGRNRLLAEVDTLKNASAFPKNGTKPRNLRYSGQWMNNIGDLLFGKEKAAMKLIPRLALYLLMTVLVAGFFTVSASATSLPGDPLYSLKLGWERTRLALAFGDDNRLELEEEFEEERLEEVEDLLEEGREEDVEFYGLIEAKGEASWIISGITVYVDALTELDGSLEIGDLVKVEALTQADGTLLALDIYGETYHDTDDDSEDASDDEMDDSSDDEIDDSSDDEMDDSSDDEMDDSSDDEMDDSSDDEMDDSSDDDGSEEYEEEEEKEEDHSDD